MLKPYQVANIVWPVPKLCYGADMLSLFMLSAPGDASWHL